MSDCLAAGEAEVFRLVCERVEVCRKVGGLCLCCSTRGRDLCGTVDLVVVRVEASGLFFDHHGGREVVVSENGRALRVSKYDSGMMVERYTNHILVGDRACLADAYDHHACYLCPSFAVSEVCARMV